MIDFDPVTGEKIEDSAHNDSQTSLRLSVDNVRHLLLSKHNEAIPKDDPMLMMVTIFNAVLDKSDAAQKAMLEGVVAKFADDLTKRLEPITNEALKGQIHAHLAKMNEAGAAIDRAMQEYKRAQLWHRILSITTILACIATVALMTR